MKRSRFCSKVCGRTTRPLRRSLYRTRGLGSSTRKEFEHRLVWIAAHGPIPKGSHVHHRNGDKRDNRLENLELLTAAEHHRRYWAERPVRLCSIDGCTRRHFSKELCRHHYKTTIGLYLYKVHNGRREGVHRIVWMRAHGPIPKGFVIHHRNGKTRDNRLANLELLTRAEHTRLTLSHPRYSARA